MNREEAIELSKKIIAQSNSLTQGEILIVTPKAGDPYSHGYQLHIKSETAKVDMTILKTLALQNNLAIESKKDLVILFRPCLIDHSNKDNDSF